MIYVEVPPGEDPIVANKLGKNTYIGKILSISGDRNQNFERDEYRPAGGRWQNNRNRGGGGRGPGGGGGGRNNNNRNFKKRY
jgi:hypothetical protein